MEGEVIIIISMINIINIIIIITGTTKESTIFEIEFDGGNRGAKVKWVTPNPTYY